MKTKKRRCNRRVMTREAQVLKYLRESCKLSMRDAGELINLSPSTISHAENGRLDLRPDLILKFLNAYNYTYPSFMDMCAGKLEIPEHLRSECIEIIKRLHEDKLKAVRAILQSF